MEDLFKIWKDKIKKIAQSATIEHVGASNIPGAKTKGDLDISVQTTIVDFNNVCKDMEKFANVHHPELWTKDFAVFNTHDQSIKIDIMVVVKDSEYDTFTKTRNILLSNPLLLDEYNAIKDDFVPQTPEYYAAKKKFFNKILAENFNILS